ncbi:hypothetical protein ACJZ2D_015937 [Fusarium nematophilum]
MLSIITQSTASPGAPRITFCEDQWRRVLGEIIMDTSLDVLRCVMLALLYSVMRADEDQCQFYRSIAIGQVYRLGLHLDQHVDSFSQSLVETRRFTFWTFYNLDCFCAAMHGVPRLLDDNVVGPFYPTPVGRQFLDQDDWGPMKHALALYDCSKILSRVLRELYSTNSGLVPPFQIMAELESDLNEWRDKMLCPSYSFSYDQRPAEEVLKVIYHYIRVLIYRFALETPLGHDYLAALTTLEISSRHIVQGMKSMATADFCIPMFLNRHDLLTICTLTQKHPLIESLTAQEEFSVLEQSCFESMRMQFGVNKDSMAQNDPDAPSNKGTAITSRNTMENSSAEIQATELPKRLSESPGKLLYNQHATQLRSSAASHGAGEYATKIFTNCKATESRYAHETPQLGTLQIKSQNLGFERESVLAPGTTSNLFNESSAAMACEHSSEWYVFIGGLDRGYYNIFDGIYGGGLLS